MQGGGELRLVPQRAGWRGKPAVSPAPCRCPTSRSGRHAGWRDLHRGVHAGRIRQRDHRQHQRLRWWAVHLRLGAADLTDSEVTLNESGLGGGAYLLGDVDLDLDYTVFSRTSRPRPGPPAPAGFSRIRRPRPRFAARETARGPTASSTTPPGSWASTPTGDQLRGGGVRLRHRPRRRGEQPLRLVRGGRGVAAELRQRRELPATRRTGAATRRPRAWAPAAAASPATTASGATSSWRPTTAASTTSACSSIPTLAATWTSTSCRTARGTRWSVERSSTGNSVGTATTSTTSAAWARRRGGHLLRGRGGLDVLGHRRHGQLRQQLQHSGAIGVGTHEERAGEQLHRDAFEDRGGPLHLFEQRSTMGR